MSDETELLVWTTSLHIIQDGTTIVTGHIKQLLQQGGDKAWLLWGLCEAERGKP